MENDNANSSKDVKPTPPSETSNTDSELRQASPDKAKQDADEALPEHERSTSENANAKEVDDLVQGKNLEKKYRGGDITDADEHKDSKEK
ncbi:MAG: hypothetical protein WKI04_17970 [Ferruginibacter sp.]